MRRYLILSALCGVMSVTTACGGCGDPEPDDNNTMKEENAKPLARITAEDSALVGNEVSASGSSSTDLDGDDLTYVWSLDTPSGSTSSFSATDTQDVTFTPDVVGDYTLSLTTNDGTVDSDTVTSTITVGSVVVNNQPPNANAGADVTIVSGERVNLDGSASSDPDGDELTYTWEISTNAGEGDQMLSGEDSATFSFTPSRPGEYVVSLTVDDGQERSVDTVTVTVTGDGVNLAPVAEAGDGAPGTVGTAYTFDGSGSTDAEDDVAGTALTYAWALTTDPSAGVDMLTAADTAAPTLTPSVIGDYVLTLTVTDSEGLMATDTVTLSVTDIGVNMLPVANAGTAQSVTVGELVMLDGGGSTDVEDDAAGTALTYAWTLTTDPSAGVDMLTGADSASPGFTPSVAGDYVISLTVTDSEGGADTAEVTISVQPVAGNQVPVAEAGAAQSVMTGSVVTLDGSGSTDVEDDAAGTALTYAWTLTTDPSAGVDMLTGADTAAPTLTPSVQGTYELTLIVTDSDGLTSTDTVQIIVQDVVVNQAPVANAGPDQTVTLGDIVTLDGSGSTDIEDDLAGTALTYSWTLTTDPSAGVDMLTGADTAAPTFTPSVEGDYGLTLTVTDSDGVMSIAMVQIAVQGVVMNQAPVSDAGAAQTVSTGDVVTLDGSGSTDVEDDAAGTALTYAWTLTTDPSAGVDMLTGADTAAPTFTPSVAGAYEATLTVTDSEGLTNTSTVQITAQNVVVNQAPVAVAGSDRYVVFGETMTLDGSDSTDAEDDVAGTALTYAWSISMDPSAGVDMLTGADTAAPTFTPSVQGIYELTLTVTDSAGLSSSDLLVVNVIDAPTVLIGERVEGSGNNKAVEVFNYGAASLDFAAVSVATLSNPNTSTSSAFNVSGALAAGDVFVLCNSGRDDMILTDVMCDGDATGPVNFNGDDTTVLYVEHDGVAGFDIAGGDYVLDVWGELGNPPAMRIYNEMGYNRCDFAPFDGGSAFVYTAYYTENAVQDDFSDLGTAPVAGCGMVMNLPPVADAGADQLVLVSDTVTLDGSGSTDAEDDAAGTALTYAWTLTTDPSAGVDMLTGADTAAPSITLSVAGTYEFTLTVMDSDGDMASDLIEVIVRPPMMGTVPPLFISEMVEGSSFNKVVEIFNGSDVDVDLTDVRIVTLSNGAASSGSSLDLTGTLLAGQVLTICHNSFDLMTYPITCDLMDSSVAGFNGDDTTVIFMEDGTSAGFSPAEDTAIDVFGQIGVRPASNPYANETYQRCDFTQFDGASAFTAGRYTPLMTMVNDFSGIGVAPANTNGIPVSTCPNSAP